MPAFPDNDVARELASSLTALPGGTPASAVATRLLELFRNGQIGPGTRLPPERQLAASLEVGRSAVREALAALEILGVVDVRPGSGTYLRGGASELLTQSLSWGLLLGDRQAEHLLELRSALEIYAARLAAERMTPGELDGLSVSLRQMTDSGGDLGEFVRADMEFHHELTVSTGNDALLDMLRIIRSLLRIWSDRAVTDEQQAGLALEDHSAVYAAIAAHDSDAAASAMAQHMQTANDRLRRLIDTGGSTETKHVTPGR